MWGSHWHITFGGEASAWFIAGGTFLLAAVTGGLAIAAWKALGQLDVATQQLRDAKQDRHLRALADFALRWDAPPISEALQMEPDYPNMKLARLVRHSQYEGSHPLRKRRKRSANRKLVVLLRVPNYFEDLSSVTQSGGLDIKLISRDFKGLALIAWDHWQPAIMQFRRFDPKAYCEFEWLMQQMETISDASPGL
jgi:hypothetical protein